VNDDDLMEGIARGDEGTFRLLVERWERPVFAFLARMAGSREEAQDLAQEVFLRVYESAKRHRPESAFRSWLFRIAGNLARSRLRRRRILRWIRFDPVLHDRPIEAEDAGRAVERDEARRSVREALGKLPERQREAMILRRFEDLSYQEIAEVMGVSLPAVESLLQRGMRALRKNLVRKGERP